MLFVLLALMGCPPPPPVGTTVTVANRSGVDTNVYLAFGADSAITTSDFVSFCSGSGLNCSFPLAKGSEQVLPLHGKYLNATISFFQPVACDTTKAEINVNNPKWYDVADISLVDGFNAPIRMQFAGQIIEAKRPTGNETAYGVYPFACDICTERQNPPCDYTTGTDGCKAGTQYDPEVPCQAQGSVMGGGQNAVVVELFDVEPV
jgi:hypothetical protein